MLAAGIYQGISKENQFMLYRLKQSLWLCGPWQIMNNSIRNGYAATTFDCPDICSLYPGQEARTLRKWMASHWQRCHQFSICSIYIPKCIIQKVELEFDEERVKIGGENIPYY